MNRITALKTLAGLFILVGAVILALASLQRTPPGVIPAGVTVAGKDWSGKSVADAAAALEEWRSERLKERLRLTLPSSGRSFEPTRRELGAEVNVKATVETAESVGRNAGFVTRVAAWFSAPKPVEILPAWKVDAAKIRAYLKQRVAPGVRRAPVSARFLPGDGGFDVVPERPGAALDIETSARAVEEQLTAPEPQPVQLAVQAVTPHVTSEDIRGIEGEIARFRTSHNGSGGRGSNIRLACSRINGVVLKPGDIFSYNDVVGPRDGSAGYRIAPVINNGRLEPGIGGGVCQVSSTLYNAALLANLKIVSRKHHLFPVRYLGAGRDATVAYGSIDFKFQNNTDSPVAIAADGSGGQVLMRIYGKKAPGREVKIETHRSGLRATVWRIVKQDGAQVSRELISRDYYRPAPPPATASRRTPSTVSRTAAPGAAARRSAPVRPAATAPSPSAVEAPPLPEPPGPTEP